MLRDRGAGQLVDEGMATPQQVDDILMFGLSRRMVYAGFFRRLDMIGLDFLGGALKEWGLPPWRALDERVDRGELGLKIGKGFYNWPGNAVEEFNRGLNTQLARFLKLDIEESTV
jgi:3-hydroxybutyryl-CoA dehydrogenase